MSERELQLKDKSAQLTAMAINSVGKSHDLALVFIMVLLRNIVFRDFMRVHFALV